MLIVEDDPDTSDLYGEFLSTCGFQPVKARNGVEAFTRACELQPDVIVADVVLPSIDGWEFVRRIKANDRTRTIPVVILTGRSNLPTLCAPSKAAAPHY